MISKLVVHHRKLSDKNASAIIPPMKDNFPVFYSLQMHTQVTHSHIFSDILNLENIAHTY